VLNYPVRMPTDVLCVKRLASIQHAELCQIYTLPNRRTAFLRSTSVQALRYWKPSVPAKLIHSVGHRIIPVAVSLLLIGFCTMTPSRLRQTSHLTEAQLEKKDTFSIDKQRGFNTSKENFVVSHAVQARKPSVAANSPYMLITSSCWSSCTWP